MMIDYNKGYVNCPVCGKRFYPSSLHAYKIQSRGQRKKVCTYSCMRKFLLEKEAKRQARKEKKHEA